MKFTLVSLLSSPIQHRSVRKMIHAFATSFFLTFFYYFTFLENGNFLEEKKVEFFMYFLTHHY